MKYSANYLKNRFRQGELIVLYAKRPYASDITLFSGIFERVDKKGGKVYFNKLEKSSLFGKEKKTLRLNFFYLYVRDIERVSSAEKLEGKLKLEIAELRDLYKQLPELLTSSSEITRAFAKRCRILRKIFKGEEGHEEEKIALTRKLRKLNLL